MKAVSCLRPLLWLSFFSAALSTAPGQITNSLPGRVIVKLVPDYLRPQMFALNRGNGTGPGTLLALSATNGTLLNEINVGIRPTDMARSPAGEALYVINGGSRTISKVDLATFTVSAEVPITTPGTYDVNNPLYLTVGRSNLVYFTDGGWAPSVTVFDYANGTNVSVFNDGNGVGGLLATRAGTILYTWRQYGWGAGNVNSWVTRNDASTGTINPLETSFVSWRRDPIDTPIFLDAAERWVFNKQQMFVATNVSILLTSFTENIYAISYDGSLAFGPTTVFNTQNGIAVTNFNFSTTVQALSGDQKKFFRYNTATTNLLVYDMAGIAPVSGPTLVPTPADGSVVGLPPTNVAWTVSPIALAYDVYLGTNQAQVTAATQNSAQYLGRVTVPTAALSQTLIPGATYFWRVDVAGFSVTNAGPTWSFTVSPLGVSPTQISIGAIAGYNPAGTTLVLTGAVPRSWSTSVAGANWTTVNPTSGTSPSTVNVSFNTAGLAAGLYTNRIDVNVGGGMTVQVPVVLDIKLLNIVKMVADYARPYIYALQAPPVSGQSGQVLFINTATGNIDKTLPIGINPVDLTVHYGEGRLYIASWTENATYVVDLTTQTLLDPLHLGTDVYKINAGKPGQLMIEGEDQWVYVSLINTTNGGTIVSGMVREGDGEFDPTGRYYYHGDNNISGAGITKFDMGSNSFTSVAGAGGYYYYGSRNVVLAPDGSRLFWTGAAYDGNLNVLGNLGEEIYATTIHGELAFGSPHVFNISNGQQIYTLPFSTSVMAVSGDQQKLFLFNTTTKQLVTIPMSSIATVAGPGLNPTPADGSVVNLPLTQLGWSPSPLALAYQVYFGTSQSAVAAADTNSPLYLGSTSGTTFSLPSALAPGTTYYWRVDSVGFSSVTAGAVWSFSSSSIAVSPQSLSLSGVVGLPILPQTLSLSAGVATPWTLSVAQPWLTASAYSGTTPSAVTLNFNTSGLAAGFYTNWLSFTASGLTQQFPVALQLFTLSASKMAVDPNRDFIYVLHPGAGGINDAFVLFLNTDTGVVETVLPIGSNPTDLSVDRRGDRLYVSNWQRSQTRVVDLATRTQLPPLSLGTDVYKINVGRTNRLIIEGEDQWVYASLIDTTTGATLASPMVRQGDGECDPTGQYYYHGDDNISGAGIAKFDLGADSFVSVASAGGHYYYGSRNIVMSLDGSRLFWTSAAYDANLVDLGVVGAEIYACSTNGSVAFGDHQAFEAATHLLIYNLPVTSSVMAVDRLDQNLWYFNSANGTLGSIPISTVRSPSVTQQPAASTSIPANGNVYLTVTAMGLSPLSYQWITSGTNLPNATNTFLSMNGIQPAQAGDYQVVVSNPFGMVTSAVAHVSVLVPPVITAQPQATNVLAGQPFSLSVSASGSGPLSYAWFFETTPVSGANGPTLTVANAQASNEGIYQVVVANSIGSATSAVALVHVLPSGPTLVSGPASVTVGASSNASFTVSAYGSQPLSYQWLFKGNPLTGATSTQLSLANVQAANAGDYQVLVTNGFGSVLSPTATLTVLPVAPYFVVQPVGASLRAGSSFTLSASARGSEPLACQWRRSSTNLPGASFSSLAFTNLGVSDSGLYDVVVSNIVSSLTSSVASVTVTTAPPVFTLQPASATVLAGGAATLSVRVSGATPLYYQWYFQGGPLLNKTNSELTLTSLTPASAGPYFVIASNVFGTATSAVAQVTVNVGPTLSQMLSNTIVHVGDTVTLSVSATGTGTLGYSWQFNGASISVTGPTLRLTNLQKTQAGYYRVSVSSQYGSVSSTARVSVFGPPAYVFAWGDDSALQTNVPPGLNNAVAVSGGDYHSLALRNDGSLLAWGYNGDGQANMPNVGLRVVGIASGAGHNLAITEAGSVVAWGRNDRGQCNVPTFVASALAVAAGDSHSLALLSSGAVVAWGDNSFSQVSGASGLTGIRAIAAGRNHSLALRNNGTVVGWGFNTYGQASPPVWLTNALAITAGYLHSAALLSNGVVVAWGDNTYGQTNVPAGLANVVAIAAGDFHTLALRVDGTVVGWGDNSYGQTSVPTNLANATDLASGYYHGLAMVPTPILRPTLTASGMVIQWDGPGVLQWAPTPQGPFSNMGVSGQSYTNNLSGSTSRFFRLRR